MTPPVPHPIDRRRFLQWSAATTVGMLGATALGMARAHAQDPGPFAHGVAAGDPLADGFIIWTRVTSGADALPGSGGGAPVTVGWEVATDPDFGDVVASGAAVTDAASDHTVKVDVRGLAAHRDHHYRFRALGITSRTGRAATAPAIGADVAGLRYGVVSCSKYQSGFFAAYRHVGERDDIDGVIHLGDYIYESATTGAVREVDPPGETVTLADYRRRYALHRIDPDLQFAHARHVWITTIDDHEVANDGHATGAAAHDAATEGDYGQRRAAALRAHFEWMPIRPPAPDEDATRLHRTLQLGDLADLVMLDLRTHRDPPAEGLSGSILVSSTEPDQPDRTMLGADQRAWLDGQLDDRRARWCIIGNSVMFSPLVFADLPDILADTGIPAALLDGVDVGAPLVLNGDQWDGYRVEQAAVRDRLAARGNVVLLTGDIHSSWAIEVPVDPATYLPVVGGPTAAVEFVTPAVTSNGFSSEVEELGLPGGELLAENLGTIVPLAAPWVRYLDAERQGFGVFEVTAEAVQFDWFHLADRADPASAATFTTAYRSTAGSNRLTPAAALAPRARPTATTPVSPSGPATPSDPPNAPAVPNGPTPTSAGTAGGSGPTLPSTGTESTPVVLAGAAAAAVALAIRHRSRRGPNGGPNGESGGEPRNDANDRPDGHPDDDLVVGRP